MLLSLRDNLAVFMPPTVETGIEIRLGSADRFVLVEPSERPDAVVPAVILLSLRADAGPTEDNPR